MFVLVLAGTASAVEVATVSPSSAATGTGLTAAVTGSGFDVSAAPSLEKLDVLHGSWTATGSLAAGRIGSSAVRLQDGRVLVAGGFQQSQAAMNSVEIYNPSSGTWSVAAPMISSRIVPSLVVLADGRVLVAGGRWDFLTNGNSTSTAEIYDPSANTWTRTGSMLTARETKLQLLLPGGRAFFIGGSHTVNGAINVLTSTELYDPSTGLFSAGPAMASPHGAGAISSLANGRWLVAGGLNGAAIGATAETYDAASNAWSWAGAMTNERYIFAMSRLPDGRLLAAGGQSNSTPFLNTSDIYDPATNSWSAGPNLATGRQVENSFAVGGRVAVVGGILNGNPLASVEVYDPAANAWLTGPVLATGAWNEAAADLADGGLLLAGGMTSAVVEVASAQRFSIPAVSIAATGVAVADVAHLSGTMSLTGAATGYWDVVVRESGGRIGRLDGGFKIVLGPPPFSGVAVGTGSVDWSWGLVAGAVGSQVLDGAGTAKSGSLAAPATSWLEAALTPNAPTTRRVSEFDANASSTTSALATVYTLAAPPASVAAAPVFVSSLTLSWSANGNPAGTFSLVERSTDAGSFAQVYAASATSFGDSGLVACTTYYYRVRDRNGDGVTTAYAAASPVLTRAAAPLPPSGLSARALLGGSVQLAWSASPSPYVDAYRIYAGTTSVDYAAPYATVSSGATGWTGPAPSTGTTYRFGVRAFSSCGGDDGNTTLVASVVPVSTMNPAALKAAIEVPETGKKVAGNRVTVMAEIASGDPAAARDVRFQYRTAASTTAAWADIPAADVQHPNPAPTVPYFIHWDVTSVPNGNYELRAVATALDGTADPVPPTIVISVDAATPDSSESVVGGSEKKDETVYSGAGRTVSLGDAGSNTVMAVTIPGSCVSSSSDTLSVTANPPVVPPPTSGLVSANQHLQISLGSGQTRLGSPATITFHYADANGAGILDGTSLPVSDLAVYAYDPASGVWRKESASVLDRTAKTISATTPHFSLFGLFSAASADLSSVRVYPVPWVPNDGNPDNGRAYSASDPDSGIVFAGLTDAVRVQVFTVAGERVWETMTDVSGGRVQWDGRNSAGRPAASGGYVAVITDRTTGAKVVRKIAIIR